VVKAVAVVPAAEAGDPEIYVAALLPYLRPEQGGRLLLSDVAGDAVEPSTVVVLRIVLKSFAFSGERQGTITCAPSLRKARTSPSPTLPVPPATTMFLPSSSPDIANTSDIFYHISQVSG